MTIEILRSHCHFPAVEPAVPASDHGWFGPEHVELLTPFLNPDLKVVLEVGSWLGKSTRWIADHAPSAQVIAIDTWHGSPEHHQNAEWKGMLPTLYDTFLKSCWAYRNRIIPVRQPSVSGLRLVHAHNIIPDVIYLDGSHEYGDVKADMETILTLFPNSDLAGDDFMWPGVERAVRESCQPRGIPILRKGNVWWKTVPRVAPLVGAQPGA